jgi:hypothetical protein
MPQRLHTVTSIRRHGKQDMPLAVGTNSHVMLGNVPLPARGSTYCEDANTGVDWWRGLCGPKRASPRSFLTNPGDALRGFMSGFCALP